MDEQRAETGLVGEKALVEPNIPAAKRMQKWRLALCQHPMFILVKEDDLCAEKEADWGGDFEHHLGRMQRNLNALDIYPGLKTCWDMNGAELEVVNEVNPILVNRLRTYTAAERITFVNGTWSQPHIQAIGHESALKQFELGLAAIEEKVGCKVRCFASQEPIITDQMPQILKELGYTSATLSHFAWTLQFLSPHKLLGYRGRLYSMDVEPTTLWVSPDGSSIPLYLADVGGPLHGGMSDEAIFWEYQKDMLRAPTLRVSYPDMIEVTPEWYEKQAENGEFALIDQEIEAEIESRPPVSRARLFPNFTLASEGISGQRLAILNRRAETVLAQLRAVEASAHRLFGRPPLDAHALWKNVLTCQHHDAYWPGGPQLREKATARLEAVIGGMEAAQKEALLHLGARLQGSVTGGVLTFNTVPLRREDVVQVQVPDDVARQIGGVNGARGSVTGQAVQDPELDNNALLLLPVEFDGMGYAFFRTEQGQAYVSAETLKAGETVQFRNRHYVASLRPDLTFERLSDARTGEPLFAASDVLPNELRAMRHDGSWLTTRESAVRTVVERGHVGALVTAEFGWEEASLSLRAELMNCRPWIAFEARFEFRDARLGDYWKDETKFCVHFPLSGADKIAYETQFAWIEGQPDLPLIANGWLDVAGARNGFAYFNYGTPKHWVSNNVLVNVLAWGDEGNQFSSRCYAGMRYQKAFDLRLKGSHTFRWAVMPHTGDHISANVAAMARFFQEPILAIMPEGGAGDLPQDMNLLCLDRDGVMPVSFEKSDRGYELLCFENGRSGAAPGLSANAFGTPNLVSIGRRPLDRLERFQIGRLEFPG